MHPLIEQFVKQAPVVLDGAWGTQLQAQGLEVGACPDAWNLEHPERVEAVARAYVEAGSQIILTNTFGANRYILERHGLADKVRDINRIGAEISRRAAGDQCRVFGSVGPSGKMLVTGDVERDELLGVFRAQAEALAEGGADGIVVETMADLEEAKAAAEAAQSCGLPVVVSMVYDAGALRDYTMMGVTPEQAAKELQAAGVDVIGANCGQGILGFIPIAKRLRNATSLPLWMKANAGLPEMVDGKIHYTTTAEQFASHIPTLLAAGATFVGGCCGTSPEFIRAVRESLN